MVQEELCLPAVNELRYAGRRLIDAWSAMRRGDTAEAIAKINDAKFDCHRARHDSIDAISSKIARDVAITINTFSLTVVVNAFPEYTNMMQILFDIQEKIEKSRAKRDDRELIYQTVESCNIDPLISAHRRLRIAEPTMVTLAEEGREKRFYEKGGFWLALIFGIIAFVEAIVLWYYPK